MPATITLAEAVTNAAAAAAANRATGVPAKRLPLWQRLYTFLTGLPLAEPQQERIEQLRFLLAREKDRLASIPGETAYRKHAAQLAYGVHLQQIDCWRDTEAAQAKAAIKELEAELELLESYPC